MLLKASAAFWDVWAQTLLLIQKSQDLVFCCLRQYGYQFIQMLVMRWRWSLLRFRMIMKCRAKRGSLKSNTLKTWDHLPHCSHRLTDEIPKHSWCTSTTRCICERTSSYICVLAAGSGGIAHAAEKPLSPPSHSQGSTRLCILTRAFHGSADLNSQARKWRFGSKLAANYSRSPSMIYCRQHSSWKGARPCRVTISEANTGQEFVFVNGAFCFCGVFFLWRYEGEKMMNEPVLFSSAGEQ